MNLEIKSIKVGELVKYIQTDEFLQADFLPISIKRAISHAMNPRADKEDEALLLAFDSSRFVGYLGIIPETCFINDLPEKVYWLSCMWILPEYRRKGIAVKLLEMAFEICQGNIFITNYIPRSKSAFLKTAQYDEFTNLNGIRAYLLFDFKHILVNKYSGLKILRPMLFLFDKALNLFCLLRLYFLLKEIQPVNRYISINYINKNIEEFINANVNGSLFKRKAEDFQWIIDFPWIKSKKDNKIDLKKYHFSQYSKDFRQWVIKITDAYETIIGFLILTLNKGVLKTPYIIADNSLIPDIAIFLLKLMTENKVSTIVSHHAQLVAQLKEMKKFFIYQRESKHGFITTSKIMERLKNSQFILHDGDGDGAFA